MPSILGLGFWVGIAYLLCILSALLCVVYGVVNWSKGDENVKSEDVEWESAEKTVEQVL